MLIIWGTRLYGRCDEVGGMFHIATRFFHVWYIPLIPMGSVVVLERSANSWRGVSVGLSGKSVFAAYARGWSFVGAVLLFIFGMTMLNDRRPDIAAAVIGFSLSAVCLVIGALAWAGPWFKKAKYERAIALAERIGVKEEGLVLIELAFNRISEQDAKEALDALHADAAEIARLQSAALTQQVAPAPPTQPAAAV